MDWNDLAQGKEQWKAPVKAVMNLPVPWNVGKFLAAAQWRLIKRGSPWSFWDMDI
jgi:hypothetical protein